MDVAVAYVSAPSVSLILGGSGEGVKNVAEEEEGRTPGDRLRYPSIRNPRLFHVRTGAVRILARCGMG